MIFSNVSLEEWMTKTGIEPDDAECACGQKCWFGDDMPAMVVCGRAPEKQSQMNSFLGID
jgi:hypothetical protein